MDLIDTHCHLNLEIFDTDLDAVIRRANENGIKTIIIPGFDLPSSNLAVKIAKQYPDIYAAIGIHPNNGDQWEDSTPQKLKELITDPLVVAIGEIGLDYYRNQINPDIQKTILQYQLKIAIESNLPVIIHSRSSTDDLLFMLEKWYSELQRTGSSLVEYPGVIHSFEGDLDTAKRLIQMNFLIGINGIVTFRNAMERQNLVANLPIENLLVETDAPYLAPHPRRGQRNEPAYVRLIAEKIASLKGFEADYIAKVTTTNAANLFKWVL